VSIPWVKYANFSKSKMAAAGGRHLEFQKVNSFRRDEAIFSPHFNSIHLAQTNIGHFGRK
jgi:hypothetical protein